MGQALVMVVDRHREHLLGVLLADHVVVQNAADLLRGGHAIPGLHEGRFRLLADDVHAELDAFIADENRRASDQLANLVLALAAEGAVESALGVVAASLGHYHISNPCWARLQPAPHTLIYERRADRKSTRLNSS